MTDEAATEAAEIMYRERVLPDEAAVAALYRVARMYVGRCWSGCAR